jgi:uncharacterized Zn finger protein
MKVLKIQRMEDEVIYLVQGEHGLYTIKQLGNIWSCTCQSFVYRGTCKHVEELKRWWYEGGIGPESNK